MKYGIVSMNTTKSSVLPTLRGFHYQILLGVEKCFELEEGDLIWFENDGDISLRSLEQGKSLQIEGKLYDRNDALTDNHLNFWKTLYNWFEDSFQHEQYNYLILHTTQAIGKKSTLSGWNDKTPEEKFEVVQIIYGKRTEEEKANKDPKGVLKYQKYVCTRVERETLKNVLSKMVINDEANDLEELIHRLTKKLIGIPTNNIDAYFDGFVGLIYRKMDKDKWSVNGTEVRERLEQLTSHYRKGNFTFPEFHGELASGEDILKHQDALFVRKIKDIQHYNEIPEAVGNYAELTNSLLLNLHQSPVFYEKTQKYKTQLSSQFRRTYHSICIEYSHIQKIPCAQLLYSKVIDEPPMQMQGCDIVPKPYKNGLIHDAMNDVEGQLKWEIE